MKTDYFFVFIFLLGAIFADGQSMQYNHPKKASIQNSFLLLAFKMAGVKKDKKSVDGHNIMTREAPMKKLYRRHIVEKTIQSKQAVYSIRSKKEDRGLTILYLHGGAYTADFLKQHWQFMSKLVRETACNVVAPDYPLTPQHSWKDNIPFVLETYRILLKVTPADSILFMGDSAGSGLIMALALAARDAGLPQPRHIVMLAPWLDLEMKNPEIDKLEKRDPMLNLPSVKRSALLYATDSSNLREPYVSPMFGTLQSLAPMSLFVGGRDVLQADSNVFQQKCSRENVPLNYYFYPKMVHVWMLVPFLPESKFAFKQILAIIGHES